MVLTPPYVIGTELSQEAAEVCPENDTYFFFGTFIIMTLFFFVSAAAGERYHFKVGHETSYTVIFGLAISLLIWYTAGTNCLAARFRFSSNFFFDIMLPPLIFNSGYTMHRKKFFQNLGNISVFGLGTTIICFVIYGVGSIYIIKTGVTMRNYSLDYQGQDTEVEISMTPL